MTPLRFLLDFVPGGQVLQKGSILNNTFLLFPFPQASEQSMNLNISKMVYNREICRLGPNYDKNGKESSRTHANQILPSRNRPKQCPSFLVTISNRIKPLWHETAFLDLIIFLRYLSIIPRARTGSESIDHEAEVLVKASYSWSKI